MKPEIEEVLRRFSYGLYMLTVEADDWPMAMVASWVSQVSYEPPLVMVSVRENRYARDLIREKKAFALHVMGRDDLEAMKIFKNPEAQQRLEGYSVRRGATGAPIVDFGLGWVECELEEEVVRGDHSIFIGRIISGEMLKQSEAATTLDYGKVYLGKF